MTVHAYYTRIQWNLSYSDTLGRTKVSILVRCPDFRGCNVHKQGVRDSLMCPVYLKVSLFQGVLIREVPLYLNMDT